MSLLQGWYASSGPSIAHLTDNGTTMIKLADVKVPQVQHVRVLEEGLSY